MSKKAFDARIHERIENMWRTHKNRVDQGLGATYSSTGFSEHMKQDSHYILPNLSFTSFRVITGAVTD
jgi:hypothetical protein